MGMPPCEAPDAPFLLFHEPPFGQSTRGARGCWSTSVHFDQTPYTSETLVALARKRTRFTTYQYASFDHRNRPTRLSEPAGGELGLARLTHLPPIVADPMEQWLCSMKMWPDGQPNEIWASVGLTVGSRE